MPYMQVTFNKVPQKLTPTPYSRSAAEGAGVAMNSVLFFLVGCAIEKMSNRITYDYDTKTVQVRSCLKNERPLTSVRHLKVRV